MQTLAAMEALVPLAPLHQPQSMRLIRAIRRLRPGLPQIASFDTAFHRTQTDLVRRFAYPRALFEDGVKRYGFHGLSYKFIAANCAGRARYCPRTRRRGASRQRRQPLRARGWHQPRHQHGLLDARRHSDGDALRGARSGRPDLSRRQERRLPSSVEDMLYHRSGLLGVSGISADSRDPDRERRAAKRARRSISSPSASPARRRRWLHARRHRRHRLHCGNRRAPAGDTQIGLPDSRGWVLRSMRRQRRTTQPGSRSGQQDPVLVIPTDEEQIIADENWLVLLQRERSMSAIVDLRANVASSSASPTRAASPMAARARSRAAGAEPRRNLPECQGRAVCPALAEALRGIHHRSLRRARPGELEAVLNASLTNGGGLISCSIDCVRTARRSPHQPGQLLG